MEEEKGLKEKKQIMMKTDNSGFVLIGIIVTTSNISFDTSNVIRMIIHLGMTLVVLYLIYRTVILNIEFTKFLKEENEELKIWEGNLWINMIALTVAVCISFFFLNNNIPNTYSVDLYMVIPLIIVYPIFRTYKRVSRLNLYKNCLYLNL